MRMRARNLVSLARRASSLDPIVAHLLVYYHLKLGSGDIDIKFARVPTGIVEQMCVAHMCAATWTKSFIGVDEKHELEYVLTGN